MFTGIIESIGTVEALVQQGSNVELTISSAISDGLKIDQSVSHNGVCLTVVKVFNGQHTVTAINETLQKTDISRWQKGTEVNLERGMQLGARLDGHIVQGHVDQTATCIESNIMDGSWYFRFEYDADLGNITIEKGSITIDGVSLTVVDSNANTFAVAIIPYTFKHTSLNTIKVGTIVNLEFDVIGKYVARLYNSRDKT